MAKQKKKQKKRKPQLSKKDKRLFRIVGTVSCIVFFILSLLNIELFIPYLSKVIAKDGAIYSTINFSIPSLIMSFTPLGFALYMLIYYDNSTNLGISFKDYYSGKNKMANKQIKTAICTALCLLVIWGAMIPITVKAYDSADTKKLTRHYITKQDEVPLDFNNVESIDVGIHHLFVGRATKTYTVYMELHDKSGNSFTMNAPDFVDNIAGMEKFLNQFDKSIITVNKKHSEHITYAFNSGYYNAYHRIFD